jgi:predicted nucleotidyltransferase
MKHIGLDKIIEKVVNKLGQLEAVYLVGEIAKGKNSKVIDLWFVGDKIDKKYLLDLMDKAEQMINRKIRYIILDNKELQDFLNTNNKNEFLLLCES